MENTKYYLNVREKLLEWQEIQKYNFDRSSSQLKPIEIGQQIYVRKRLINRYFLRKSPTFVADQSRTKFALNLARELKETANTYTSERQ